MCRITCSTCDGYGKIKCYHCNGSGVEYVYDEEEEREIPAICPKCNGEKVIECPTCFGRGDVIDRY